MQRSITNSKQIGKVGKNSKSKKVKKGKRKKKQLIENKKLVRTVPKNSVTQKNEKPGKLGIQKKKTQQETLTQKENLEMAIKKKTTGNLRNKQLNERKKKEKVVKDLETNKLVAEKSDKVMNILNFPNIGPPPAIITSLIENESSVREWVRFFH